MRWYELRSRHLTNEEYVERVRKNLQTMDRFRPWIIASYVVLIVAMGMFVVPMMVKSIQLMVAFQPPGGAVWPVVSGFASGIGLGFVFMSMVYMPVIAMMLSLMPLRTDRLLLQYYDAQQEAEISLASAAAHDERLPSTVR